MSMELFDKYLEKPLLDEHKRENRSFGVLDTLYGAVKEMDEEMSGSLNCIRSIKITKESKLCGVKLMPLNLRSEYGVNIIAVKRSGTTDAEITTSGETILNEGDTAVVTGERNNLDNFEIHFGLKGLPADYLKKGGKK